MKLTLRDSIRGRRRRGGNLRLGGCLKATCERNNDEGSQKMFHGSDQSANNLCMNDGRLADVSCSSNEQVPRALMDG